ncbi:MAG: exodeoxyribonuclease VII small subunit [Clostridiales bacterium]|nr:exodeoxyribonuclease VII small subunit [Clostridiales bacterium]
MQDPAVTLEESFELYKRGMDLVRSCNERIDTVEKKVKILEDNADA